MSWSWRTKRTPKWVPTSQEAVEHMAGWRGADVSTLGPGDQLELDPGSGLTVRKEGEKRKAQQEIFTFGGGA